MPRLRVSLFALLVAVHLGVLVGALLRHFIVVAVEVVIHGCCSFLVVDLVKNGSVVRTAALRLTPSPLGLPDSFRLVYLRQHPLKISASAFCKRLGSPACFCLAVSIHLTLR